MTACVALLRGIGPGNPDMRNENLRRVCEEVGLRGVATVISSGNVIFDADPDDLPDVEARLEAAWPERLGFRSTTITRSRHELEEILEQRPFGDLEHGPRTSLLVTFAKEELSLDVDLPFRPPGLGYEVVVARPRELFTVTHLESAPDGAVMGWVERQLGKRITSRSWLTVERIFKRMG